MLRSSLSFVLFLSAALACAGQSPDSAAPSQANAAPASSSAAASQTPAAKPAASDQNASKDKKKSKKVWTNEEVSSGGGGVSVVGDANRVSDTNNQNQDSPRPSGEYSPSWYRNKLRPLHDQVADIDRKIQEMKNTKGAPRENVASQVEILETKRAKIQAQVDQIEEDARHHGVEPGDLR